MGRSSDDPEAEPCSYLPDLRFDLPYGLANERVSARHYDWMIGRDQQRNYVAAFDQGAQRVLKLRRDFRIDSGLDDVV